jgi:hypothetical protein
MRGKEKESSDSANGNEGKRLAGEKTKRYSERHGERGVGRRKKREILQAILSLESRVWVTALPHNFCCGAAPEGYSPLHQVPGENPQPLYQKQERIYETCEYTRELMWKSRAIFLFVIQRFVVEL